MSQLTLQVRLAPRTRAAMLDSRAALTPADQAGASAQYLHWPHAWSVTHPVTTTRIVGSMRVRALVLAGPVHQVNLRSV